VPVNRPSATLRLALFDADGSIKQAESPYLYLHAELGAEALGWANRDLARAGQIDYAEWLRRDVALWAGQPVARIRQLLDRNPYIPGAPELLRYLKRCGIPVALVSAGFTLNTDPIMAEFGLDYCLANVLTTSDGRLDGGAINHVPEGGKGRFARQLMDQLGVIGAETLAVGDTDGDLELFALAGVKIAVNPRSAELRATADAVFEPDLSGAITWLVSRGLAPDLSGGAIR
jgi:phosphoserine phosphatase